MPIINEEKWNEFKKHNVGGYGGYIVKVAELLAKKLDEDKTPLHFNYDKTDTHSSFGMICLADIECGDEGLTGFQAECATQMILECHSRGKEFYTNSKEREVSE